MQKADAPDYNKAYESQYLKAQSELGSSVSGIHFDFNLRPSVSYHDTLALKSALTLASLLSVGLFWA